MDIVDLQSFAWQFKEIFIDELYAFKENDEVPIIYDCGANIGMSALYFAKQYPNAKIVAYEADPELAELCEENLRKNGIKNVKVEQSAVWVNDCGVLFRPDGADGGVIVEDDTGYRLPSIRLKDVLDKEEKISMLKMDIEGAETEVIKDCGDVLQKVDNIFVEYHSVVGKPQALDTLLRVLRKNSFRYWIQGLYEKNKPLMHKVSKTNMDLQLNIFAYKYEAEN